MFPEGEEISETAALMIETVRETVGAIFKEIMGYLDMTLRGCCSKRRNVRKGRAGQIGALVDEELHDPCVTTVCCSTDRGPSVFVPSIEVRSCFK